MRTGGSSASPGRHDPYDFHDDPFDDPEPDDVPRRARHDDRRGSERRSGGFLGGLYRTLKLVLLLGPITLLAASYFLIDCRPNSHSMFIPKMLKSGLCARNEMAGTLSTLKQHMETVGRSIR